jgi:hypothetical protein
MIDSLTPAAGLPQTDPDQAHAVAHAEGRATLELLRTLGDDDWARPTDCPEWDVRALVAHLVAQCQDSIHLASMAGSLSGCAARLPPISLGELDE